VRTIAGTASASTAHILPSQQRHGRGPRRRKLCVVPEPPRRLTRTAGAHSILPTAEPVGSTQPSFPDAPPSDWTIRPTREPIKTCPTTRHRSSPSQAQ
jgi:hypothetical protein